MTTRPGPDQTAETFRAVVTCAVPLTCGVCGAVLLGVGEHDVQQPVHLERLGDGRNRFTGAFTHECIAPPLKETLETPPADVRPPLGDEELAELGKGHTNMGTPFGTPNICRRCSHYWPCPTERLIATLRAKDEELDDMRSVLEDMKVLIAGLREGEEHRSGLHSEEVAALQERCRASRAEVERLRAEERWTASQIIDAGHALGWPDHDVASMVAMLQENPEVG